jgi:sugar phosphate isomerase/epimerase
MYKFVRTLQAGWRQKGLASGTIYEYECRSGVSRGDAMVGGQLSMCEITTRDWTFAEDAEGYAAAGIGLLGVFHPKLAAHGVARAVSLLRARGLRAVSMISNAYLTGTTDNLNAAAYDQQLRVLDDCAALGISRLVAVPGLLHGRSNSRMTGLTIECLGRLAGEAAARGVVLALEPIRFPYFDFLNTLEDATRIVRTIDRPNVGLVFDTWHLWNEPDLLARISEAVDKIVLVHLSDYRAATTIHDDRLLPGDGVIPLPAILGHLDGLGYEGIYEVEIFSESLWKSDYTALLARCRSWFDAHSAGVAS